jgi:hypothetical protein
VEGDDVSEDGWEDDGDVLDVEAVDVAAAVGLRIACWSWKALVTGKVVEAVPT